MHSLHSNQPSHCGYHASFGGNDVDKLWIPIAVGWFSGTKYPGSDHESPTLWCLSVDFPLRSVCIVWTASSNMPSSPGSINRIMNAHEFRDSSFLKHEPDNGLRVQQNEISTATAFRKLRTSYLCVTRSTPVSAQRAISSTNVRITFRMGVGHWGSRF